MKRPPRGFVALAGLAVVLGGLGIVVLVAVEDRAREAGLLLATAAGLLGVASGGIGRHLSADLGRQSEVRHVAEPRMSARSRRRVLIAGGLAAVGALALPVVAGGRAAESRRRATAWRRGARLVTSEGRPVDRGTLEVGALVDCWPEDAVGAADASVVLLRVRTDRLQLPPERQAWAPEGFVAYSKLCTHMGCPVGLYQSDPPVVICPCHQAVFDVLDGARPVGGPASRALPQLPLAFDDDGALRAQDDFDEPVGPGWWSRPA